MAEKNVFDGKTELDYEVVFAITDPGVSTTIGAREKTTGQSGQLNIFFKKFNPDTNKREPDPQTTEKAKKAAETFDLTLNQLQVADADQLVGKTFKGYSKDISTIRLEPIQGAKFYYSPQQEDVEILRTLDYPVQSLPFLEEVGGNFNQYRFSGGIEVDGANDPRSIRFTQMRSADGRKVKLDYRNSTIKQLTTQLKSSTLDNAARDAMQEILDRTIETCRAQKVDEIQSVFGFDIDEAIENQTPVTVTSVETLPTPNGGHWYAIATVVREDSAKSAKDAKSAEPTQAAKASAKAATDDIEVPFE